MIIENGAGWRGRLWGWAGRQLSRYGGLVEASASPWPAAEESSTRPLSEYAARWAYAENKGLYRLLHEWGLVEQAMATARNPVPAVVDFYVANVLNGELTIEPEQRATADGAVSNAAENEGLAAAVGRVWEWSNFVVLKGELVRAAAVYGDVLLKAAERTDGGGQVVSVYLQLLPIQHVRYCRTDERGIVQEVRIDTPRLVSLFGTAEREHTLVEIWRKAWDGGEGGVGTPGGVRFFEVEGRGYVADKELPAAVLVQTFGELGYDFIPVVWARCETPWWDATDQIDYYNELARKSEQLNVPLGVVRARATDSEGRPMPAPKVDAARLQASYHKVAGGAAALLYLPGNSEFDWSSAPIDFAALYRDMEAVWAGIVASLPEYRAATLDASTQIAAETLELLLKAAGQRVLDARGALERALVRAQQMALTMGQMAGLAGFAAADIGAYEAGDFGHVFTARDVFEPTLAAKAAALKELTAAGVPVKLALELAQFGAAVVEAFDAAAAEQALRERVTLASALVRARAEVDSGAGDNGVTRV